MVESQKSIVKNSIFNIIYKGFTALFPLVTTTYIARTLLPEAVGRVSYANTIVTYFVTVAALGLPNYGVKKIAQNSQSKGERSKTFWELYSINLVSTFACIVAYYLFINLIGYFESRRVLFNVMGTLLLLNLFNIDWFYQGIEEYGYIAIRSILIKILSFAAMLLFVHEPGDYLIYAVILCTATGGNYVFNMVHVHKYLGIPVGRLNVKPHLPPIFILLASTLATEIYTALDTIMLEYIHGEIYVGYYSNAVKIVRMIYTVVIAMVAPFYPRISLWIKEKKFDESNELVSTGVKALSVIGIPTVIGLFLTSNQMVYILFGAEYASSVFTLKILSILVLVFSFAYFLGHLILMAASQEKAILKATVCGAALNACMNMLLIPKLQQNGAALASVIAEIAVTILLISRAKEFFKLHIELRFWISIALAASALIFVVVIIQQIFSNSLASFAASVSVGAVSYFVIMILLRNSFVMDVISKIRNR